MHLNFTDPDFDLLHEMLCLLPIEPTFARVEDVAIDLGCDNQRRVTRLMEEAEAQGIRIETFRDGERRIALSRRTSSQAQAAGEDYWRKVYEC